MSLLRRLIGLVILLTAITGLGLAVVGARLAQRAVTDLGTQTDAVLTGAIATLDTVEETLLLTRTTIDQVNESLDTVELAALDVAETISDTAPLLTQINAVASDSVPASLEAVESAVPSLVEVATVIDDTLTTLSRFRFRQRIFGVLVDFGLGVDYAPPVPFDRSVQQIGDSLDGVPEQLRSIGVFVDLAQGNLAVVGQDLELVAGDLAAINRSVALLPAILNDYIRLVRSARDGLLRAQAQLDAQVMLAQRIVIFATLWLVLTQIAPLYLGAELLLGRRMTGLQVSDEVQLLEESADGAEAPPETEIILDESPDALAVPAGAEEGAHTPPPTAAPRRRGRPPKRPPAEAQAAGLEAPEGPGDAEATISPAGAGQPASPVGDETPPPKPKRRGRPRKRPPDDDPAPTSVNDHPAPDLDEPQV